MPPKVEAQPTEQAGTQLDLTEAVAAQEKAVQPDTESEKLTEREAASNAIIEQAQDDKQQKTQEQIDAENAERMRAKLTPSKSVQKPAAKQDGALPTELQTVNSPPRKRGNTPLPVRGAKNGGSRIPDEYDVVLDGEIIGRHPDEKERAKILKAAS